MPMYEYKCDVCGKMESRIVKFSNAEDQLCGCSEGVKINKVDAYYVTSFRLKGSGWYNRGK